MDLVTGEFWVTSLGLCPGLRNPQFEVGSGAGLCLPEAEQVLAGQMNLLLSLCR